jgi:hypothetical protein
MTQDDSSTEGDSSSDSPEDTVEVAMDDGTVIKMNETPPKPHFRFMTLEPLPDLPTEDLEHRADD